MKNIDEIIKQLLNLYKKDKLQEAEILNKKLIKKYPKSVFFYNFYGLILSKKGKINKAIEIYNEGLEIKKDYAPLYDNLGTAYKNIGDYKKAEYHYKESIKLDENNPEPQNNLGNLYLLMNRDKEAVVFYNKAIINNPKFFISYYNLGNVYKNIGKFAEAKKCFIQAIKLNKFFYSAHRTLSNLIKYKEDDEHYKHMIQIYHDKSITGDDKTELLFALGKAAEEIGNYDKSFFFFSEANNLRKKNIHFSIDKEKKEFHEIKLTFNKILFNKVHQDLNDDETAIFILGMPRSGTTLVEQIISSHKNVFGADELPFLNNLVLKYINNPSKGLFLKDIKTFNLQKFSNIGNEYIKNLRQLTKSSKKITDKMPINFKWIGLIKLILPNSKIIHCIRNSHDNCFSIYKNYFANKELNYAYDLEDISTFYNLYNDLMNYWKSVLPDFIYDIKYEDLVQNPHKRIPELITQCDLVWDENCLKHYNNKRIIRTASDTQARKKIYKSSINSWKNYEKNLKKIFNKLP